MPVVPGEGAGQDPAVVRPEAGEASAGDGTGPSAAISAIAIGLAAGLGIGIASYVGSHQSGPPTATATGSPVAESVAPGSTDLQALRQDFGPWRQLADGPTDSPALLLLENGAAYASERWTVPSGATWWAQDLGGNVTSVTRSGDHAIIRRRRRHRLHRWRQSGVHHLQ